MWTIWDDTTEEGKRWWKCETTTTKTDKNIQITRYTSILHESECWNLQKREESKILSIEIGWLRKILGVSRLQKMRNETVGNILEQDETIIDRIHKRRLTWFGHVERTKYNWLPHKTLHCYVECVRSRWRQRKTWIDNVKEDLETLKQRRNWYETDRSGGISCSLIISSADVREQRRRTSDTFSSPRSIYPFLQ